MFSDEKEVREVNIRVKWIICHSLISSYLGNQKEKFLEYVFVKFEKAIFLY